MLGRSQEADVLSAVFDELLPIMRSISGDGIRQSYSILKKLMPLCVEDIKSGTQVFDWVVPPEWKFKSARLSGPDGEVLADSELNTLSVVNYSDGVDKVLSLDELQGHLHSLPSIPDAVPYVTSYYKRDWGFCLPDRKRRLLRSGKYHAKIDASFDDDGSVPIAHCVLDGESKKEVLLTSYLCHPGMANNELSGPLALAALYNRIANWPRRRLTYRFLLNPETIGSLCFLHLHGRDVGRKIISGMILTCVGGPQKNLSYKASRRGDGLLDRVMIAIEKGDIKTRNGIRLRPFTPIGSDERQYCSPGFNWPMGQIVRAQYLEYEGYHNSLDTKEFMDIGQVMAAVDDIEEALTIAELSCRFENLFPFGEPQLGRRGLYPTQNSPSTIAKSNDQMADGKEFLNHVRYLLMYSDGEHSALDIAKICDSDIRAMAPAIERLEQAGLIRAAP